MDVIAAIAVMSVVLGLTYHYWRDRIWVRAAADFPYERSGGFLSEAESRFLQVLKVATSNRLLVCPKVRVGDCVSVRKGLKRHASQIANSRMVANHFDFAIVDAIARRVVLVVELDDEPILSRKARQREVFVSGACAAAGIPLARFRAAQSYDAGQVREALATAINSVKAADVAPPPPAGPRCPECAGELELCVIKTGPLNGTSVWRCVRRPACRGFALDSSPPSHLMEA